MGLMFTDKLLSCCDAKQAKRVSVNNLFAFVCYVFVGLIYLTPVFFFGKSLLIDAWDHVPTYVRMVDRAQWLSQLMIPLWDPKTFSGLSFVDSVPTTHILNLQPWIMAFAGNHTGYAICIFMFITFGAYGTYLLCYRKLQINWGLSLCAGSTVVFGPFIGNAYSSVFVFFPFISFYFYNFMNIFEKSSIRRILYNSILASFPVVLCMYTQEPRFIEFIFYSSILYFITMIFVNNDRKALIFKQTVLFALFAGVLCVLMSGPMIFPMVLEVFKQQRIGAGEILPRIISFPPWLYLLNVVMGNLYPLNLTVLHDTLRVKLLGSYFTLYFEFVHILFYAVLFVSIKFLHKFSTVEKSIILSAIVLKIIIAVHAYVPGFMYFWTLIFKTGRFLENDTSFFFSALMVFIVLNKIIKGDITLEGKLHTFSSWLISIQILISVVLIVFLIYLRFFFDVNMLLEVAGMQHYLSYLGDVNLLMDSFKSRFPYLIPGLVCIIIQLSIFRELMRNKSIARYKISLFMVMLFCTPLFLSKAYWPFNNIVERDKIETPDRQFLSSLNILDRVNNVDHDANKLSEGMKTKIISIHSNESLEWAIKCYPPAMMSFIHHFIPVDMYKYFNYMYKDEKSIKSPYQRFYFYPQDNNLFHLLGINYFFSELPVHDSPFEASGRFGNYFVYKNPHAFPRFYFADSVFFIEDNDSILGKLYYTPIKKLKTEVFVNAVGRGDGEQFFSNKKRDVSLIMYSPNKITLKTESPGRQFLVLTDTFDKRWNAYIDKKQINTYKANFLFRGVMIPPGIHTVEFQYCYPEFKIYVLIAVLTFLSCISIVCIVNKYNDVPTG